MHIRRDDIVELISGDDAGKQGRVLSVNPTTGKAVVEGVNFIYRHVKASRKYPQGGRIQKEAPVAACSLLPVCTHCNRGVRVGYRRDEGGRTQRVCRKCGEPIGEPS